MPSVKIHRKENKIMSRGRKKVTEAEIENPEVVETEAVNKEAEADSEVVAANEETNEETANETGSENNADGTTEAPRKKRKYTKRKTADKKADKSSAKKSKKEAKETEYVQEVFIEHNDAQILSESIVNRIKETYKNEGHRISSIKKLQVYINIDQKKAYYVINDKHEGKFVEF